MKRFLLCSFLLSVAATSSFSAEAKEEMGASVENKFVAAAKMRTVEKVDPSGKVEKESTSESNSEWNLGADLKAPLASINKTLDKSGKDSGDIS